MRRIIEDNLRCIRSRFQRKQHDAEEDVSFSQRATAANGTLGSGNGDVAEEIVEEIAGCRRGMETEQDEATCFFLFK